MIGIITSKTCIVNRELTIFFIIVLRCIKRKGVQALENSIPAAKMNRVGDDVIKHLEEQVKIYREKLD